MKEENESKPLIVIENGRRQRRRYDSEFVGQASKYRPEFNEAVLDHLGQGFSLYSFPAVLYEQFDVMISIPTIYNWIKEFPDFMLAKEVGEAKGLMLHESLLRCVETGFIPDNFKVQGIKKLNLKAIMFILTTRFRRTYPLTHQNQVNEQEASKIIQINIDQGEENL